MKAGKLTFLKASGTKIVDENNNEIIFEGYGLGNWMVQEGFMFGTGAFQGGFKPFERSVGMERPRTINQILLETCGSKYTKSFWQKYYQYYVSEEDIKYMAELGFNSVRLPLLARAFLEEEPEITFVEETFKMLDDVISLCEKYKMYVVLDMHAAMAGQSTVGCDDGVDNAPHLFTDTEGYERSIILWEKLANRYKDCATVAGYELLNEPIALPKWDYLIPNLLKFYDDCIERIRKIDKKHIIFLQGHRFAKRADIFDRKMDEVSNNWVLTMHSYETLPDLGLIGPFLAERERLKVPLWVGECGGDVNWTTVFCEMLRQYGIGYNIWGEKSVTRKGAAALCTYETPEGFEKIVNYAYKGEAKPSFEEAQKIFDSYLEVVKFDNCKKHPHRAAAILRKAEVSVPAIGFDVKDGKGKSFSGKYPYCSFCGYRREDNMEMVLADSGLAYEQNEFKAIAAEPVPKYGDYNRLALKLSEGDFACYTVRGQDDKVSVLIEVVKCDDCKVRLECKDKMVEQRIVAIDENKEVYLTDVSVDGEAVITLSCIYGSVIVKNIIFRM